MSAICLASDEDDTARLAAAEFLAASGEPLRADYIRACCRLPVGVKETLLDRPVLPADSHFAPLSGWVPFGEMLGYWERGFVTRLCGPLDVVRRELPALMLREPLYQTPDRPAVVSVTDRAPFRLDTLDGDESWTWGSFSHETDDVTIEAGGPMLPSDLFDLLPWPPIFDTQSAAAVALSSALLSEAHERLSEFG